MSRWLRAESAHEPLALVWRAAAHRPLPLILDVALGLAQGTLTGVAVAALGNLVNRRDLAALLVWGGTLLLGAACGQARPRLSRLAQQGLREALGLELTRAAERLPYEDLQRRDVLIALERASDLLQGDRVYQALQADISLLTQGAGLVSVAAVLLLLSPWLVVPALAAVAVQVGADALRVRQRFDLDRRMRAGQRFADYLQGLLGNRAVNAESRVFGTARWIIGRWWQVWSGLQEAQARLAIREMRRDALARGSALTVYLGTLVYAVVLAQHGALSVGGVVALAAGVRAAQGATEEISYQLADVQGHGLYLADAFRVLRRSRDRTPGLPPLRATETITVRRVHYRYPAARGEALRGASLTLRRGYLLALVGENGSGKTTLARILLGLLPPSAGRVEGDGDATEWGGAGGEAHPMPRRGGRSALPPVHGAAEDVDHAATPTVGVLDGPTAEARPLQRSAVLQDFARYQLTLLENVGLGDAARVVDAAAVRAALARACSAAQAAAYPPLETVLGHMFPGGVELSGGQWQGVATARGVFARGDLLVLDEPTAALDPLAEREVFARFADLARGRFAVIVTHRLGAAALAAKVAVMRRGRVVEHGTHSALVAAGGHYARMWEAQARWYR